MNVARLAAQAATMKGWPMSTLATGEARFDVVPYQGRKQAVFITMAKDGDGDAAAFVWAKCGELAAVRDPMGLLGMNMQLTYGRIALRGTDLVVVHALHDASAGLAEVGKSMYWVARAADDVERLLYGAKSDVL